MHADRTLWSTWWRLDRRDLAWLVGLTLVAGLLRFGSPFFPDFLGHPGVGPPITAWGIGHSYQSPEQLSDCRPESIAPCSPFVFDELYFANDAHNDLLGRDYLDPEPPLAKLIIALGIKRFGYTSFGWRVMSALFGTALIPLMYLLARQLLPIRFFAVVAGLLTTFDGMTFVQSRIGMIDIFPIVFVVVSYLLFHLHLHSDTRARQRATIVLTGLVIGLALGAKWISLAAYGTIAVILVVRAVRGLIRYDVATGFVVLASLTLLPAAVYLLSFTRYLTISHSIGAETLPAALAFAPFRFDLGAAWHALAVFHRWTFDYHYTLRAPHPYYSPWYSWPVLYRPVAYYYQGTGLGTDAATGSGLVAEIFNLGNPLIWWVSVPAIIGVAALAAFRRSYPAMFILLAFAAAWLPFSRIPRGLFLYHIFGGLPFMILATALVLTVLRPAALREGGFSRQNLRAGLPIYAYLVAVIAVFMYFYPLWTGLPLTYDSWREHLWFPSWF